MSVCSLFVHFNCEPAVKMTRYSVVLLVRSISSLQFSCVCLTQNPICGNWFMGTQTATESFPWNFSACYPCTFFLFVCILSCATGLQKYYKSRKKSSVYENTIIAALLSLTTGSAVPARVKNAVRMRVFPASGAYLPLKLYAITKQTRFRPRNSKK